VERGDANQILAIKPTVIAGFLRAGVFYTRAEAARAVPKKRLYRWINLLRRHPRNPRRACA
jgi:hypothetical protein